MASIIVVAGVSSVGKTSVCQALQEQLREPYLYVGLDHFFAMFPHHWRDNPRGPGAGFWYEESEDTDGSPRSVIKYGPAGTRLLTGMRQAVLALLDSGNNVILDEMPIDDTIIPAWHTELSGQPTLWIRLVAPLPIMEAREQNRTRGRQLGNARGHFGVNYGDGWDLTLSTEYCSPRETATKIIDACAFC